MIKIETIRKIVSKISQTVEPEFKIYSPDENTELTNDDGATPFGRIIDVNSTNVLALDPNWQNTSIAYRVTLATVEPPDTTANYWIEINGTKKRINFGKYVQKHGFYTVYFMGDWAKVHPQEEKEQNAPIDKLINL